MYVEIGHKVSRSALAISLAACVALCISVAPDEKAYADTATEGLLQSILSGQGGIRNQIDNIYASLGPLSADGNTYATIVECCNAIYDYLQSGSSVSSGVAGCYRVLGLIRTDLTTLSWLYIYLTAQTDTVTIDGTTLNTPRYYLKYLHTIANNQQFLLNAIDTLWQADSYMDENQQSHYTPFYYLKQIYNSLYRNNTSVAGYLDGIRDNTYQNKNTVSSINTALTTLNTAIGTVNTTLSSIEYYIIKIQQALVDNYQNNTSGVQVNTIKNLVEQIKNHLTYNNTSVAGYLSSINNKMDTLHSDFGTLGNNLTGIGASINAILALMAMDDVVSDVVGDFDSVDFSDNVDEVKDDMQNIAVYSSVVALGTYISQLNVQPVNEPSITMPFTFAGSNENVVISVSWLDDVKPLINFALLFMLFLGLTAWSVNIVSRGQS